MTKDIDSEKALSLEVKAKIVSSNSLLIAKDDQREDTHNSSRMKLSQMNKNDKNNNQSM